LVDELAGDLLGAVARERIVALGGGRVVDTAKALAAASGGTQVAMAVPTTLSGAEMTRIHRRARGADQRAPTVRPRVVVNDPALSASQPVAELAASALNALSHAAEGPCTPLANPVARLAADDGARRLARSLQAEPDRDGLALGALLAGYVIDSTGYGLHHVLSQTLVRLAGASHGAANAVLLSHTLGALAWRFPERVDTLGTALGDDPAEVAARMCELTGATRLRDIGVERDVLAECAGAAAERPELDLTPPRADRAELMALYEGAW
jgi:alcohol dehydrogenase class IV